MKILLKNIIAIILPITIFRMSSYAIADGIDNDGDNRRI